MPAQTQGQKKAPAVAKTPWGDPDLQGVWNDATSPTQAELFDATVRLGNVLEERTREAGLLGIVGIGHCPGSYAASSPRDGLRSFENC